MTLGNVLRQCECGVETNPGKGPGLDRQVSLLMHEPIGHSSEFPLVSTKSLGGVSLPFSNFLP